MNSIPPEISARLDDILKLRDVPLFSRPAYRKWVRYFLDFQAKYPLPRERSVQVRLFSEKLRSKGQAEMQVEQAADAISLFFASQQKQQAVPSSYDIRTIQELLGHADVRTTMIYTHCVPSKTIKELKSPLDF